METGQLSLRVTKTNPSATLPRRATALSAGFDLTSIEAAIIPPLSRKLVSTGLVVTVPPGTYGRIAPRSGLALRSGIHVGAGVIDADYAGVVHVLLFNLDASESFEVNIGDRVAQLILERAVYEGVSVVDASADPSASSADVLGQLERGTGGFGSTGVGGFTAPSGGPYTPANGK
jgi:dUTP pyrophosphatase